MSKDLFSFKKKSIGLKEVLFFFARLLRSFPSGAFFLFFCPFLLASSITFFHYFMGQFFDVLAQSPKELLAETLRNPLLGLFGALLMELTVYRVAGYFISIQFLPYLRIKLIQQAFERALNKSYEEFQKRLSGEGAAQISDLGFCVPEVLEISLWHVFYPFFVLLMTLKAIGSAHGVFSLLTFLWSVCFIGINILFSSYASKLGSGLSERNNRITGLLNNTFSNILVVRLFQGIKLELQHLNLFTKESLRAERKLTWSYFLMYSGLSIVYVAVFAITFYFLIHCYKNDLLSLGTLTVIIGLNEKLSHLLWESAQSFQTLGKLFGRVRQSLQSLQMASGLSLQNLPALQLKKCPEIVFEDVCFGYEAERDILSHLSLSISAGEKVAIIGPSGSGKSTLMKLLLGLHTPKSGKIFIDGQDITQVNAESLHQICDVIPQEPGLFSRSILENVRYGYPEASLEDVYTACRKAYIHDFITSLPKGYQTPAGEQGCFLSGGQKQRLAIARAFLKPSFILGIDEATSQLDAITEQDIQLSLHELMKGKTTLVIAHRVATLELMDRLLVLNQGRIIEQGTHQELLKNQGYYYHILGHQEHGQQIIL